MKNKIILPVMVAAIISLAALIVFFNSRQPVYLSDRPGVRFYQEWGQLMLDKSIDGNRLSVNGLVFYKGLGTHANSWLTYNLAGKFKSLAGACGLDDEQNAGNQIEFFIYGDNNLLFQSGILQGKNNPRPFNVPLAGVKELKLVVGSGPDGINYDHADWLDLKLLP